MFASGNVAFILQAFDPILLKLFLVCVVIVVVLLVVQGKDGGRWWLH